MANVNVQEWLSAGNYQSCIHVCFNKFCDSAAIGHFIKDVNLHNGMYIPPQKEEKWEMVRNSLAKFLPRVFVLLGC